MVKRLGSVFFFVLMAMVAGCPQPPDEIIEKDYVKQKIIEGKYSLSNFEADRARAIFMDVNETYYAKYNKFHCEASYGVVLADAQVVVTLLNNVLIRPLLTGALAPAPYAPMALPESRGGYRTAASKPHDFGIELENLWAPKFEPILAEMSMYAAAVTSLPNCTFSIGVGDEPVDELNNDENPYKWVLNFGDSHEPIAQIVFRGRLDGAEARIIEALGRSTLGLMNLVLAHDLSLTIDLVKIAYLLGAPVDCIQEDALDCVTKIISGEVTTVPVDLLESAFIFADNPKLLTKSLAVPNVPQSDRWERRFQYVDNQFARGFFTLRDLFPALIARSAALEGNVVSDEVFNQYLILFRDNNEDGKVDAGDTLGFNLNSNGSGVKLSCDYIITMRQLPEAEAQKCRNSMSDYEDIANSGLALVKELFTPSEEAIGDINKFTDRMYGNMAAVDNPNITAERIPINSFDNVIRDFFLELVNQPTPPFMEFDVKAYFTDAKPWRDFLPYWERTTTAWTFSRFIVDSDTYAACKTLTAAGKHVTLASASECGKYGTGTTFYISAPDFLFNTKYVDYQLFPNAVTERAVLQGPYDEGRITTLAAPADCLNPKNLNAKLSSKIGTLENFPGTVMYFPLRDPSINSTIYINMDEWALRYDNVDNGASSFDMPPLGPGAEDFACSDPSGFQLPDNQMLTKSMWLYLDFLADHIALTQLLGPVLGTLGSQ